MMKHFLVAAVLIAATGCGGGSEVDLGEVTGTVTLDGKPLPNAYVQFIPQGGGRPAGGTTDEAGNYKLIYSASAAGALVGPAKVSITTGDPEDPKRPEKLGPGYNSKTTLTAEVTPGDNVHNFDLTSK